MASERVGSERMLGDKEQKLQKKKGPVLRVDEAVGIVMLSHSVLPSAIPAPCASTFRSTLPVPAWLP